MGVFDWLFPRKEQPFQSTQSKLRLFEQNVGSFTSFGADMYQNDTVRQTVHIIASNVAKLKAVHIRRTNNDITNVHSTIEKMLQFAPNSTVNAYDFLYKLTTELMLKNNAFVYVKYGVVGNVEGFYNIRYDTVEIEFDEETNELYAKFQNNGATGVCLYSDLIHIRRHFNENDIFGSSNSETMQPIVELLHTQNEGIMNAITKSAKLRGILKFTQGMLKPEAIKQQRDIFVGDFLGIENDGGIAALDGKADYIPLSNDFKLVDDKQMAFTEEKVFKYFNVSKNIVQSTYNEQEWNAFYENVIEPIAVQLSLEFTNKLFTSKEKGFGNEIVFEANRLQHASAQTKISLVRDLAPLGLFTINECRELFNLAPVEGGDKRLQTLNVVDAEKANDYQGVGGVSDDKASENAPSNGNESVTE